MQKLIHCILGHHFLYLIYSLAHIFIVVYFQVDVNVGSRIGSLANVKHKPGGGDKKIFDDKEYTRQMNELGGGNMTRSGSSSLTGSTWDNEMTGSSMGTLPRSKRSVTTPGTSFQSQIIRKLVTNPIHFQLRKQL